MTPVVASTRRSWPRSSRPSTGARHERPFRPRHGPRARHRAGDRSPSRRPDRGREHGRRRIDVPPAADAGESAARSPGPLEPTVDDPPALDAVTREARPWPPCVHACHRRAGGAHDLAGGDRGPPRRGRRGLSRQTAEILRHSGAVVVEATNASRACAARRRGHPTWSSSTWRCRPRRHRGPHSSQER